MPKPTPPTLRERNRYMTFRILCDAKPDRKAVVNAIWNSLLRLYGESGASETSLWVMDWADDKSKGIVKVNHKSVEKIRSALALVREVDGRPAAFHVLKTSGTLKSARELL